ncbi:MAG: 50S ribosomal protein L11 methyltransferase [Verrucomicrobiales bacterium]|nr:50S ribosomal protein L11 methyltransferase [Verrucomicrobiales bacterium]MCP5525731.1 50S ribosomal protein L11 methyltransferase [Verrucomicrobiales bacterium]
MKAEPLWQLRLRVCPTAEEVVAGLIEDVFGEAPVLYTDVDRNRSEVSLYRPGRQKPSRADMDCVAAGLRELRRAGRLPGRPRATLRPVPNEDWAESWKRHFKARVFGGRVLVRPSWSRRRARAGEIELVLDPGLSFGTGQHATTAFCLEQIVRERAANTGATRGLLDAGAGSGILAIAAAKLGYAPVEAFDHDPDAVRIAAENAAANGVGDRLQINRRDVARLSLKPRRRFAVVAANLLADLLLEQRDRLIAPVAPGGLLILAGILERQFAAVRRAYEQAGFRLESHRIEREWQSGAFRRRG